MRDDGRGIDVPRIVVRPQKHDWLLHRVHGRRLQLRTLWRDLQRWGSDLVGTETEVQALQVTATPVTFPEATVPEPLVTVQLWPLGLVLTLTL